MTDIDKLIEEIKFFDNRRKQASEKKYKKPKIILVDIDGTIIKPKVKMYSMAEEKLGKQAINKIEKERIRPLRKRMIKKEISFEKYLIELSKIDIELGECIEDYELFFYELVKRDLVNLPLVKALENLLKKDKIKIIFLTSNLKEYGEIISKNILKIIGSEGQFNGAVGTEYKYDSSDKAIGIKTLISHKDGFYEEIKFMTKQTAIESFFKKNKLKINKDEIAVISDADIPLMKFYGIGGLVYYPLNELSRQFKEIQYVQNARKGLYDFRVNYSKGKDLEIAQKKWEAILRNPNLIQYSESELRNILK